LSIKPDQVWPDVPPDKRTLWTARLFPATTIQDSASAVLMLADESPDRAKISRWKKSRRYSMAMLLETADPSAMIAHREMVAAYLQAIGMIDAIERGEDQPLAERLGHFAATEAYAAAEQVLSQWANQSPISPTRAIDQARAYWCIAQLQQRPDHPDAATARKQIEHNMAGAFAKVAQASECVPTQTKSAIPTNTLRAGRQIIATAPVRLDLTGGWTDTPPYCFERGGMVVNLAIDLDGRPPVRATVSTLPKRRITLESLDLARQINLDEFDPAAPVDVRDPFALHKVALRLAGLLPEDGNVRRHLSRLGVGLHVTTECRVPKGSGLGTSSILAATLLGALHAACQRTISHEQLIEQTLVLEQRLSTGGGWQDQVGGIIGGTIFTQTAAGVPQKLLIEPLKLSNEQYAALADRLVVYYSGQQRLARDILRRVMGRWLAREPAVLLLMDELNQSALSMRQALISGRWKAVGSEIERYWRIKKELYPGSTTPAVDVLFLELRHLYLAAGLSGAGGGGFAYFFCRDARQAQQLKSALREHSSQPGSMGTVFDTRINRQGLRIERKTL
jgi:fucokinase